MKHLRDAIKASARHGRALDYEEPRRSRHLQRDEDGLDALPTAMGMRHRLSVRHFRTRSPMWGAAYHAVQRMLPAEVGRPWNTVLSEAFARMPGDDPSSRQFREQMLDIAREVTVRDDGVPVWARGRFTGMPVTQWRSKTPVFYVDAHGILRSHMDRKTVHQERVYGDLMATHDPTVMIQRLEVGKGTRRSHAWFAVFGEPRTIIHGWIVDGRSSVIYQRQDRAKEALSRILRANDIGYHGGNDEPKIEPFAGYSAAKCLINGLMPHVPMQHMGSLRDTQHVVFTHRRMLTESEREALRLPDPVLATTSWTRRALHLPMDLKRVS
jgi:hypothetical protein